MEELPTLQNWPGAHNEQEAAKPVLKLPWSHRIGRVDDVGQ